MRGFKVVLNNVENLILTFLHLCINFYMQIFGNKNVDLWSDASPPRRKRRDSSPDQSPKRHRKRVDSDNSPTRRKRADSDASPPRYTQNPFSSDIIFFSFWSENSKLKKFFRDSDKRELSVSRALTRILIIS